ncbi:MAG: 23S rRNA (adenine(2503)-C(2))-methyltransferase RlmN, partial [Halomonas sp.]
MTTTVAQHTPAPRPGADSTGTNSTDANSSDAASTPAAKAMPERHNLLGMSREQMETFFLSIGEKKFRAAQLMKWIHQEGSDDFAAMTNLSKSLREKLAQVAEIRGPAVVYEGPSSDGT